MGASKLKIYKSVQAYEDTLENRVLTSLSYSRLHMKRALSMRFLFALLEDLWDSECNALTAVLQHSVWLIDCKSLHRVPRSLVGSRSLNKINSANVLLVNVASKAWQHHSFQNGLNSLEKQSPAYLVDDPNTLYLIPASCMLHFRKKAVVWWNLHRENWRRVTRKITVHSLTVKLFCKGSESYPALTGNFVRLHFSLGKFSNQALTYQIKLN